MIKKSYIRWDKNSIAFRFMLLFIVLIIAQSLLIVATMIIAGVLDEAKDSAFQSFDEKVSSQKDTIQKEISNRWTNIDPFLKEISKKIPTNATETDQFLKEVQPILISMLRTTTTTGAFILLDDKLENPNQRPGLYIRDYDPLLNDEENKDLYAIAGPVGFSEKNKIPLDTNWSYHLKLTNANRAFYDLPYSKGNLSTNSNLLGYFSTPFQLTPNDAPIITYSVPIFDSYNQLRGVLGVEILVDYLNQFLPGKDLLSRDSLGYLIGYRNNAKDDISPLITNGAIQNRILQKESALELLQKDKNRSIYLLENRSIQDDIYASVKKIDMYYSNTPFEKEEWYLIGLTEENKLLSLVNKIKSILIFSFIGSILVGGIGVYGISYVFTKPIVRLAKQVRQSDFEKNTAFSRTGLTEIDDLSHAIKTANQNLMDSTIKISQIINLVDVPIGAFEYKEHEEKVFMTDQLKALLQFDHDESEHLPTNKQAFIHRLQQIMSYAEPEEEDVYKIVGLRDKWVRINMINEQNSTLGIVIDVTDEFQEKRQIKLDRDYDTLTKIFNRGAFKRAVTIRLQQGNLGCSACIMLDLDFLKVVNDTYGHKWGDIYISTTADYLSQFKEAGGIIGRLSGDEFAVFLHGFEQKEQIRSLVQQFFDKLAHNPIAFPDEDRHIRISGGLFWLDPPTEQYEYDAIMHSADEALYLAKKTAKGTLKEFQ